VRKELQKLYHQSYEHLTRLLFDTLKGIRTEPGAKAKDEYIGSLNEFGRSILLNGSPQVMRAWATQVMRAWAKGAWRTGMRFPTQRSA